jgi:hypothetical protein
LPPINFPELTKVLLQDVFLSDDLFIGAIVDSDPSHSPLPEPGTLALVGVGLGALLAAACHLNSCASRQVRILRAF